MLNKLKENGVNVDLIKRIPSGWLSILMVIVVCIASVVSNGWTDFIIYMGVLVGWMIGVFFGFRMILIRIEQIDEDKSDE